MYLVHEQSSTIAAAYEWHEAWHSSSVSVMVCRAFTLGTMSSRGAHILTVLKFK
jgi:hypothetical protein